MSATKGSQNCHMAWVCRALTSSIGRKIQMALTGLLLCGFLVAHLAGNLFLYSGPEKFNHYAQALANNELLPIAEIGLVFLFVVHIITAILVTRVNRGARPVAYEASGSAGKKTLASTTMIYSGLLLLAFLIVHLKTFRFAPDRSDLYALVMAWFGNRLYAGFYVLAMGALGLHLSHGFWSGFQTIGVNHPKYMPWIKGFGLLFAVVIAAGFASIPLWAGFLR